MAVVLFRSGFIFPINNVSEIMRPWREEWEDCILKYMLEKDVSACGTAHMVEDGLLRVVQHKITCLYALISGDVTIVKLIPRT